MNSSPIPARERRRLWVFVLGGLFGVVLLAAVGIYNLVTLTSEAATLRRAVFAASASPPDLKIQGSVGSIVLGAAGVVLRFIPDVPAEARQALAAIDSVSVGLYEFREASTGGNRLAMVARIDEMMLRRGWTRLVVVSQRKETVVVYAPAEDLSERRVRICLAFWDGRELAIASARINAQSLAELVQRQLPELHAGRLMAGKR